LTKVPFLTKTNINEKKSQNETFLESKNSQNGSLHHIVQEQEGPRKEQELSLSLIMYFYNTIGQTKISKEKREL
jgi:hypothetical protein